MLAALTSLGIFAYCTVVGLGLIAALTRERTSYLPLLAPVLGAAALIIPAIWVSEAGIPIGRGGPVLLAVMLAAAVLSLWRWGHRLELRRYWPFLPILLAGFLLAAWPMFEFGFNWLSYSNDDMANYVLNAQRLLELGWFTVPAYNVYNFNKDPTAIYWMNWTVNNERYGAEMIVTLTLSILRRLNGFQLFMPVMAALGLMQIAAAAALVYRDERYRTAAILTAVLVAISAEATFGIEYQLLAQLAGLPLLLAAVTLVCALPQKMDWRSVLLAVVATTGMAMVYPEITPFFFLTIGLYYAVQLWRKRFPVRTTALWFASISVLTTMFINLYLRNYLTVMESRVAQANAGENTRFFILTFPFYLIPSGIPSMFGLLSGVQSIPEPWFSLLIALGFALLAIAFVSAFQALFRNEPGGATVLVMLALGLLLFKSQNGFGLFKTAMYLQPFMIGCLVLWWLRFRSRLAKPVVAVALLVTFGLLNLSTQQFYVDRSRALWSKSGSTFVEIPNASGSQLLDEFQDLSRVAARTGATFLSDSSNVVFAKIESFYARPSNIVFPSDNYLPGTFMVPPDPIIQRLLIPDLVSKAIEMSTERGRHFRKPDYFFIDDYGRLAFNGFFADTDVAEFERNPRNVLMVEDTAAQSVLNRRYNSETKRNFQVRPLAGVRNHLIFVAARYGLAYYSHSRDSALFQVEPDLFFQGSTMAGMGRRFLFAIVNSSKKVRLEISWTTTLKDDGQCILYDPFITGKTLDRHYGAVIGRGSARVFLPAVAPRFMVGQPYVMLDMGVNGTLFPAHRTGLMLLYGRKIPLDGRLLVGFARNISAISEDDYRRMRPPVFLHNPAADLANENLEYSGAYEDGWISESSQYVLQRPAGASVLTVRGIVPLIGDPDYHARLRVYAGGREIGREELGVGTFDVQMPVRSDMPVRAQVKLLFDHFQRLPGGDDRPVAIKMTGLGFESPQQAAAASTQVLLTNRQRSRWWDALDKARIAFGDGWYPLETYEGETFRWANNDAQIVLRAPTSDTSTMQLDVEPGPGEKSAQGTLRLLDGAGHEIGSAAIQGRQLVTFHLKRSAGPQTYVLHIDGGGATVASDPRILNFRVFSVSVK